MTQIITSIIILIVFGVLLYIQYNLINSFGEIIVKFIEQNQEYYKNQKHLVEKSSNLTIDMKKLSSINNEVKRTFTKIQETSKSLDMNDIINKISSEIIKISSENSKLNSIVNKLSAEVAKLSNVKHKRE